MSAPLPLSLTTKPLNGVTFSAGSPHFTASMEESLRNASKKELKELWLNWGKRYDEECAHTSAKEGLVCDVLMRIHHNLQHKDTDTMAEKMITALILYWHKQGQITQPESSTPYEKMFEKVYREAAPQPEKVTFRSILSALKERLAPQKI